jgi:DNA polymerase-3 subunit beta
MRLICQGDMKATIERATLLKSLGHVQSVVERRNTIPILSNVLIEASDNGAIRLMATDLDLQIVETIAGACRNRRGDHGFAHTLFEIARKLPEGSQVQLNAADGKMRSMPGVRASTCPRCRATISR